MEVRSVCRKTPGVPFLDPRSESQEGSWEPLLMRAICRQETLKSLPDLARASSWDFTDLVWVPVPSPFSIEPKRKGGVYSD